MSAIFSKEKKSLFENQYTKNNNKKFWQTVKAFLATLTKKDETSSRSRMSLKYLIHFL